MEANLRETVAKLEDTDSEPGDLPAQQAGGETSRRWQEGPLTDYQIGMIGGGLLGLAAGMLLGALMTLRGRCAAE